MERWNDKIILVTGASSGIGAAICEKLLDYNLKVVGLARRVELVTELAKRLRDKPGTMFPLKCDVSKREDIGHAFKYIRDNIGLVNVVINNAGISKISSFTGDDYSAWQQILDTNLLGAMECARLGITHMSSSGSDGHVIMINSLSGKMPAIGPTGAITSMYAASKHALRCASETLRNELAYSALRIKVSSVFPGYTDTEIFEKAGNKDGPIRLDPSFPITIKPQHVADCVIYALGTPKTVQIHDITIMGTTYE